MERRILFVSLLPTIALAFALAAGDDPSPSGGEMTRVGTTVVEPAEVARGQARMATLSDVAR